MNNDRPKYVPENRVDDGHAVEGGVDKLAKSTFGGHRIIPGTDLDDDYAELDPDDLDDLEFDDDMMY